METIEQVSDWDLFIHLINENGIIALAFFNLRSMGLLENLPLVVQSRLQNSYMASLGRNTLIFKTFSDVANIASQAGVKIVPLKGLHLEKTLYGDVGLRQMNDLDILVSEEDAIKFRRVLLSQGYTSNPIISPIHSRFLYLTGKHLPEMFHNGFAVEIHFRLFSDKGNILTRKYLSLSTNPFPGSLDKVMAPPEQLNFLYLVKHLALHEEKGSSQLRLYCDLVFLLEKNGYHIINPSLWELARLANIEDDLKRVLYLLHRYFGLNTGIESCRNSSQAESTFIEFLRSPKKDVDEESGESFSEQLAYIEKIHHKILFSIGMIFPSLTFMKWRYGAKTRLSALLFYPFRWGVMVKKVLGSRY